MRTPAKKVESLSAFDDKSSAPTETDLHRTLGPAATAWKQLVSHVYSTYSQPAEQWNFAGAKYGWSLRLKSADRVILYLIPQAGQFLVGIVLGGKAVSAAQTADLPAAIVAALAEAPRYAEGTGLRLPVADENQLPPIRTLAALKMARP
jgi:hypothetical protein